MSKAHIEQSSEARIAAIYGMTVEEVHAILGTEPPQEVKKETVHRNLEPGICAHCGTKFEPITKNQMFCSDGCRELDAELQSASDHQQDLFDQMQSMRRFWLGHGKYPAGDTYASLEETAFQIVEEDQI